MKNQGRKLHYRGLLLLLLISCGLTIEGLSQSSEIRGIPYFQVYETRDYPAEQQMFDVIRWHDGSMLFANAGGLVQHADDDWRVFARFDATFISKIIPSRYDSTLVWAGSYSNIGYFIQYENGEFEYFTLSDKIPEEFSDFSNVYDVIERENDVLFFSDLYLFSYSVVDSTFSTISEVEYQGKTGELTNYINWKGGEYYFLISGDIIKKEGNNWVKVEVQGISPTQVFQSRAHENVVYLYDLEEGVLRFDGENVQQFAPEVSTYIKEHSFNDMIVTENHEIVISTDAGVLVLNSLGDLKYILNVDTGLQENVVSAITFDHEGDLWMIGESTITQVYTSIPVRHFPGEALTFGDALHINEHEGSLIVPALNGLYRIDQPLTNLVNTSLDDIIFKYELESTFWNSLAIDDEIWVASQAGVFQLSGDELLPIAPGIEARQLRALTENMVMVVTYNGLDLLIRENGSWNYKGTIGEVPEHILELAVIPDKEFWAGGVSGDVFRGILNEAKNEYEVRKYSIESGLPETDLLEPTFTDNEIIVNSKYGFYRFDPESETFTPIESINEQLGNWGEYLRMDQYGVMWTQYANIEGFNGVIEIVPNEELDWIANFTPFEITTDNFGDFLEVRGNTVWVGSTESLIHMDITEDFNPTIPEISLWSIKSNFDQEFISYLVPIPPEIQYEQKDVELSFISSAYRYPTKNEFRFKLGDREWSEWRNESTISINPFFPGQQNITVQTRDFMRVESEPTVFRIMIIAPWYLSNVAYFLYAISFLGLFYLAVRSVATYRIKQQVKDIKLKEIERIIELDEMKTKLLINISHELRTPLTLVTGPVKQLLDSNKVDDDFLLHKLKVAHRNGRRLHDLVEQVLDLSRLDSNIVQFIPVEIPMISFTKKVVESFEASIEKKALIVTIDVPEDEFNVQADVDKLEKILVNLLSNAIKFTPEKGKVEIKIVDHEEEVQISVIDSGRGIEPSDLPHVFDRFHSTSDQLEGGGQGIGVGLSITKEFVELHEGTITVESEVKKGATFLLRLPKKNYEDVSAYQIEASNNDRVSEQSPVQLSVNGKEYTALVVEDNPDMREYVADLLNQLNIRVEQAGNGLEGKKQMSVLTPDIVISDIMMPEMNGFEFAQWMRSIPEFKQIPIILLSARSEVEDKVHGFQIGVSDYLTKPFNAQELQARVDNLLVLKKEREEMAAKTNGEEVPLSVDSEFVQQLQEYVESKIDHSDISVDDLANQVAMSARNLQRNLKSITGFTPNEFIREIRLFTARDLLETKQKRSISEVAYAIGFSTPAYFSRQYKKRFGTSPSQYF